MATQPTRTGGHRRGNDSAADGGHHRDDDLIECSIKIPIELSETDKAYIGVVIGLIVLMWTATFLLHAISGLAHSELGQIGDTFGITNSLFSGLALAGVAFAIILQHRELTEARTESRKTSKALSEQAYLQNLTTRLDAANSIAQTYSSKVQTFNQPTQTFERQIAEERFDKYRLELEALNSEIRLAVELAASGANPVVVFRRHFEESVNRLLFEYGSLSTTERCTRRRLKDLVDSGILEVANLMSKVNEGRLAIDAGPNAHLVLSIHNFLQELRSFRDNLDRGSPPEDREAGTELERVLSEFVREG
jgi:hypothetical protein